MKYIKLMLFNAFQTNKESLSIHQGSWGMMLASLSYPKWACHWKDQPLNQLERLCLSVPFAPLASYFFGAFMGINNLSIRMFGCQRKLINASFMDCSVMETRKVCTPLIGKSSRNPGMHFLVFGISISCQESRFFFLLVITMWLTIRAICSAFDCPRNVLYFSTTSCCWQHSSSL